MTPPTASATPTARARQTLERVVIRFAGDSGDGVQITGQQFTTTAATYGNDLSTFPDFPAEIRAPAGTLPGVSGYQIQFSSQDIHTPGDQPDVLVAFNPAALMVNIKDLPANGVVIVNTDSFEEVDLKKAQLTQNPLTDGTLKGYQVYEVPIAELTIKALESSTIPHKDKERCKNFFALGILYWLYSRPLDNTLGWFKMKFGKKPEVVEANSLALKAGFAYAEACELFRSQYTVPPAKYAPGKYRNISGNEAIALGLVAAGQLANRAIFYGSYPITPASDVLHELSRHKNFGVITFQAEDEIAAVTASIGASYTGLIGVTGTSGPGVALKSEAINLAVMVELPLIIVDVQRGGPSTGLPTKTEQADLLQAMYGRNSESPVCVLAPQTPGDCFHIAIEAVRIATKYMCPVFILSDGYLANGAEPWKIPNVKEMAPIKITFAADPAKFSPYLRDEVTLSRPWAIPGTKGLEHRVGGIEKKNITGNIDYAPENHDYMCRVRAAKIQRIASDIPDLEVTGDQDAKILMLGWGSPFGSITAACEEARRQGVKVAQAHLRHLNPFPANLGKVLARFKRVLIPELNLGQLLKMIRATYLVDARGIDKAAGQPFKVAELVDVITEEAKGL